MICSARSANEKVVIVCDALDEAGIGPNGNVLGLPTSLPVGVYLILSQRPVSVPLFIQAPLKRFDLKPDLNDNLADITKYLTAVASEPQVAKQLQLHKYSKQTFVQTLTNKSGGNWMYLHYVVDEIRHKKRTPLDLANLPEGLVGYYTHYWGKWRANHLEDGKWDAMYLPLLAALAIGQEAVDAKTLCAWSGIQANPQTIKRLLSETWRPYLIEHNYIGYLNAILFK
jgi:hypothetical protein